MGWNETLILWLLKSGRVAITIYLKKCIKACGERSEEEEERIQEVETKQKKLLSCLTCVPQQHQPDCASGHKSSNKEEFKDGKDTLFHFREVYL